MARRLPEMPPEEPENGLRALRDGCDTVRSGLPGDSPARQILRPPLQQDLLAIFPLLAAYRFPPVASVLSSPFRTPSSRDPGFPR